MTRPADPACECGAGHRDWEECFPVEDKPRAPLHVPREDTENDREWATYAAVSRAKRRSR